MSAHRHIFLFPLVHTGSSIATARAMLSVAELLPWRASHTTESLLLSLDARTAAAAAAADISASESPAVPHRGDPDERLDPRFHCREAEAAVRSFAFRLRADVAPGEAVHAVHSTVPVPAEVYLQLMAVHDAAGQPLEAVRVALQVMAGELPLQSGAAAGGGGTTAGGLQSEAAAGGGDAAAAAEGLQDIVAGAMRMANGVGAYRATVLVFLESLSRGGGVVSDGAVIELVSATRGMWVTLGNGRGHQDA